MDNPHYLYKMLQLPQTYVVKKDTGSEIAGFLENEVNTMASKGWEFYRIDQVGVLVSPGCLAAFTGTKQTMTYYNIAIFRRLVGMHN